MSNGWDLEEKCEDALIAYLRQELAGTVKLYPAMTNDDIQFPAIVVSAMSSSQLSDGVPFTGHRQVDVEVRLAVEPNGELDASLNEMLSPRELNRRVRDNVVTILANDSLHDEVNTVGTDGVLFSMITMTDAARSIEDGRFITVINMQAIASPKEL